MSAINALCFINKVQGVSSRAENTLSRPLSFIKHAFRPVCQQLGRGFHEAGA
jgi:hypothetical protein